MKHILVVIIMVCFYHIANAQQAEQQSVVTQVLSAVRDTTEKEPTRSKLFNFDFLIRTGLNADNLGEKNELTRFSMDEARLLFYGDYNNRLSYKIRFRLNSPTTPSALDNAPRSLDYAYLEYKFGQLNNWSLTLGKQGANIGSYEFENNPVYESIFTDYINQIVNLFVVGSKLSYTANSNHGFHLQVYNTINSTFDHYLGNNGYKAENYTRAKAPLGAYLTWTGAFADKRFQTKWSYNISQFAQGYLNHAISLGNKYQTAKQMIYLDLLYAHFGLDQPLIASSAINLLNTSAPGNNVFAKNVTYKAVVLRYDQFLTDKWEIALKGAVETAGSKESFGNNFRTNYTYFAALQYKPFKTQDMRFYLGYMGNTVSYASNVNLQKAQFNRLALGAYFTLPVFKTKS